MRRFAGLALLLALVLGGCGKSTDEVSDTASAALEHHVSQVRVAAAAGDGPRLLANLSELRTAVATLQAQGEISAAGAAAILREADAVQQQSGVLTATTATTAPPPVRAVTNDPGTRKPDKHDKHGEKGGDSGD